MNRLGTAIEIKKCIEESSKRLKPIGDCPQSIWEYKLEQYGELSPEESRKLKCIDNLKQALQSTYYTEFAFKDLDLEIKIKSKRFTIDIAQEELKTLYEKANAAGYGDAKTLETKIDAEIRSSKEIDQLEVSPEIIKLVEENWSKAMYPRKVKAVPYKLNLYSGEDHFTEHLDTPDKNLVGTALISLWSGYLGTSLSISDVNRTHKYYWNPTNPSCVMFYTDCPHEVKNRNLKGIRATLAFKIYACENQDSLQLQQLKMVTENLETLLEKTQTRGFILEHGYSLETDSFTGSDAVLISALEHIGKQIEVLPVIYHFQLSVDHNYPEGDSWSSLVYPFRNKEIDYLLTDNQQVFSDMPIEDVEFCILNSKYFIWKNEHQQYAEHTGNESRPEEQNSIYLSRAVFVKNI